MQYNIFSLETRYNKLTLGEVMKDEWDMNEITEKQQEIITRKAQIEILQNSAKVTNPKFVVAMNIFVALCGKDLIDTDKMTELSLSLAESFIKKYDAT